MWYGYGYIYAAIFSLALFLSACFRQYYMFSGAVIATNVRKTIISAMYDKCFTLSMKAMTETNSGKLITLISADIFTVERLSLIHI